MRKIILSLLLLVVSVSLQAQTVPDNELIIREINNASSPYYYPELFARYSLGDTTLTLTHYHYLYYGYAFHVDYRPLESNTAADNLLMAFEDRSLSEEDRNRSILKYAQQSFHYDPFSPTNINFLTYIYGSLGDSKNERINSDRLEKIIATITSSGTGTEEKSPWHVLFFSHSNDIMIFMGKKTDKRMVISRTTEFFPLQKKEGKIRGYYFDFSRAYMNKPENPQRRKSPGFELNGTKL